MEKQRNRGQDGVGVGVAQLGVSEGREYFPRAAKATRVRWINYGIAFTAILPMLILMAI